MADEKPEQIKPEEESKKDTVRINLPPGLTSRAPATQPIPAPPPPPPVKPATAAAVTDDEAKKQTAVMGKPVTAPKPKTDTSRVQVPGKAAEEAKPGLKLKREGEPAAAPVAAAPAAVAAAPSGPNAALSVVAMLLAIAVTVYLAWLTMG